MHRNCSVFNVHNNNFENHSPSLQRNTRIVNRAHSSPTARNHSNVRYNKLSTKSSSSSNNRSLPEAASKGNSPSHHIDDEVDDDDDYIITTSFDDERKESEPIIRFSHHNNTATKKDYSRTCDRRRGGYVGHEEEGDGDVDVDVDDESATFLPKV